MEKEKKTTVVPPQSDRMAKLLQSKNSKAFLPIFFALLCTLAVYFLLVPILRSINTSGANYIVDVLVNRGFIQYFTVFFFWLVIGKLSLASIQIKREVRAHEVIRKGYDIKEGKAWTDADSLILVLNNEFSLYSYSITFKRIKEGLLRMKNTQDTNALMEYFKLRSDMEYTEMDSEFTEVKYYNWLIPTLGFIGTVLGIGKGMMGFAGMVVNANSFDYVKDYLPKVTNSLGVAFDTTFLALVLSAIGMFYSSFLSKKYGKMLESVDAYCLDEVSSKFKLYSTVADQLQKVFNLMNEEIIRTLNANAQELRELLSPFMIQLNNIGRSLQGIAGQLTDLSQVRDVVQNAQEDIHDMRESMVAKEDKDINVLSDRITKQMISKESYEETSERIIKVLTTMSKELKTMNSKSTNSNDQ